ncbi:heavy metal translocating P-type ATPase [Arenibacter sp. N53]|uniref:heavy metal translocating P-type ATPase n=1 Tax=Arenibacter TaxID=178469 RepID=UPI000CD401F6|nr:MULTISPECIES: heavy metal translocating P-type ATPase [Arenibacter]MCM4152379.1 heavy metal translocating P-type ATPase [Arenibacter sp. N53]
MKHQHDHEVGGHNHEHDHRGIFNERTELYFAIFSGVFFLIGLILSTLFNTPTWAPLVGFISAYFFGGYFTLLEAIAKIRKGEFEIDFLMIVAALGAAFIDSWGEGALLLFLFSLGHALEHYAMNKATKSIKALGELSPKTAFLKNGKDIREVPVEDLKLNDIILVKPNTKISADGVIVKGSSSIDQSPITGESIPVDKTAVPNFKDLPEFSKIEKSHIVFMGTINGDAILEIQVLKLNKDATISRLVKMVNEVETKKSPTQLLTKKFEKWFVPAVILLVVSLSFVHLIIDETVKESLYRAISVLVASSPCAMAISTPSAVLSAIARAAKKGVLIKGGRTLEDLGSLTTIAFDKTGTLTEGKPRLTNALPLNAYDINEFLVMVVDVESLSNHPLAKAITKDIIEKYDIESQHRSSNMQAIQGKGVKAQYNGGYIFIGNTQLMEEEGIQITAETQYQINRLQEDGQTVMLVGYNQELIGLLSVMDVPRESAAATLVRLKDMGIKQMIMLTGDDQKVGDSIARQIGLTEAKGNLLPEDKVKAIQEFQEKGVKIAMVGDGVNDAPAMASCTVGIAMGAAGSDVALETADVALLSDRIESLPFVIGLSRKSKLIIKQNLWISMGVVTFLIPATLFGFANIGIAVAIHEGSTLLVVINALRLLRFNQD